MSEFTPTGKHLLIDFYDCQLDLSDKEFVEDSLGKSAKESGATIVSQHFHKFNPFGISGVIIIEESHFTVHTWPEHKFASVDFYTCGDTINFEQAVNVLKKAFGAQRIIKKQFERGNQLIKQLI